MLNNLQQEFCTPEQSLALKKLGFDEPCIAIDNGTGLLFYGNFKSTHEYYKENAIILKKQVFRWFKDKHNLFGIVDLQVCTPTHWYFRIDNLITNDYIYHSEDNQLSWKIYEDAENACIDKLIEISLLF
jgi:hypothetical protein